ncbi:hypothetical protein, unknown function [Leishmania tarentolae]|uniref:Uncharacterized protein n=1 Tax=Leishmania tarentolae TaxID=5689 RepID=A0A640KW96_LEITA|nr:hypothetical protein, unknown function [Leishmania tarentolae]
MLGCVPDCEHGCPLSPLALWPMQPPSTWTLRTLLRLLCPFRSFCLSPLGDGVGLPVVHPRHAATSLRGITDSISTGITGYLWRTQLASHQQHRLFMRRPGTSLRRLRHTSVAATTPRQLEAHPTFVSLQPFCDGRALLQHQHEPAAHAHRFLSASQVVCSRATRAQNSAAGLSVTLPPLCAWGSCADAGGGSSSRYSDVWAPIESYLAQLSAADACNNGGKSGMTPAGPSPPLCLVLRLFPDLTIAQLPALRRGSEGHTKSPGRLCNGFIAPHEYPLDAILGAEELWGGGADPQRVFRDSIDCLHEVGQRLLPKLPLVLQLPTRLLVSQQFLHDLAVLLVRDSWRSVSFELPSTHQLYSCSAGRAGAEVRTPTTTTSATDVGAVDAAWCRLPILCTPWPTLCRHPALGRTLRQLRRHDVVPFHVLYSWAVAEMQLFKDFELSIAVDTTAPMPGEEALHAYLQGPSSVGRSAEEFDSASLQTPRQLCDSTDAARSVSQTEGGAHRTQRHVYMSENPMTAGRAARGFSDGVLNTLQRRDASKKPFESHKPGLDCVEKEWRLGRHTSATSRSVTATAVAHTPDAFSGSQSGLSISLDAPPDHLRALIEKSIVDSDVTAPSPLSQRRRSVQKAAQAVQRTTEEPSATTSGYTGSPSSTSTSDDDQIAPSMEAEELGRLLRETNDASDAGRASFDMDMIMAEVQRYTCAHVPTPPVHREDRCGLHGAPGTDPGVIVNAWSAFPGYWSCMHAIVEDVTHATLLWTSPTFNKAAVQAWTAAYYASQQPRAGHGEEHISTRNSPLPLVVPIYMPVQSVMHVEVGRLLREGRWFEQPPLLQSREEGEVLHTWLPAPLNVALADTLSRLPGLYQALERRRLLRDHQRLRKEGAKGACRDCSVLEPAAAPPTCSELGEEDVEPYPMLIRIHQEARSLFLLTPTQAERREAQAFKEVAAVCVTAGEEATKLDKAVRGANKIFAQAVEEAYCTDSAASDADLAHKTPSLRLLHVPTPGLGVDELNRSWRCLSS